jgi:PAS domain S-box-containing protein
MGQKILVVDDQENIRFTFERFLMAEGYDVKTAKAYHEALSHLGEEPFDLVFSDIVLGHKTGIDILKKIRSVDSACPVVLITGYPDVKTASDAVRLGAFDYITKPVEKEALLRIAKLALQHKSSTDKAERCRQNLEAIFRSVQHPIIAVDDRLEVIEINEAARTILGLTSEAIGKSVRFLSFGCGRECLEAVEETIKKNQTVEIHRLECRGQAREKYLVSLTSSPLMDGKDDVCGAVLMLKDPVRVTDRERDLKSKAFMKILGRSKKMQEIFNLIEDLADGPSTVLITGESGTGKELVADALHFAGRRKDKPFIKVSLPALPETLVESELFGHVKGAFTGALSDKPGRFQLAHEGSILLDEIGDLTGKMQLSLLRILQEKKFERVGDSTSIRVDMRVIAATNQDLRKKMERGEFREDLYYRLKVVEIRLPPLRERKKDIPLLADHFIEGFNSSLNKRIQGISEDVLRLFMRYHWPGNVRELKHTIEHACVLCRGNLLTPDHLPPDFRDSLKDRFVSIRKNQREPEPQAILHALEKTAGNKSRAAGLLGISRRTIYRKIEEYKINQ